MASLAPGVELTLLFEYKKTACSFCEKLLFLCNTPRLVIQWKSHFSQKLTDCLLPSQGRTLAGRWSIVCRRLRLPLTLGPFAHWASTFMPGTCLHYNWFCGIFAHLTQSDLLWAKSGGIHVCRSPFHFCCWNGNPAQSQALLLNWTIGQRWWIYVVSVAKGVKHKCDGDTCIIV